MISRKGATFESGDAQAAAFSTLKKQLAEATELAYFVQGAPVKVIANASSVGLGAVLVQTQDEADRAVCYAS